MGFAAFLIVFVLIGSVSATDDNITALSQGTYNEIGQDEISTGNDGSGLKEIENEEISETIDGLKTSVSGDTFADIQTAIGSAESGDTIELEGLYKGSGTEITIDKNNLTIIGNGTILDAQGQSRILNITGTGVTLKNIRFINGNATDNGGAIYWYGDNGTISNCNFSNNKATQRGGAIYWYGVNGTISNSVFTNNTVAKYSGSAIQWDAHSANGTVNNCNFTNNSGAQKGGAIYWYGVNGTISNSNFINNNAIYGGAVYWEDNAFYGTANNCNFIGNTGNDGGAVYWYGANGRMDSCNFTNNAGDNGGAINWQRTYGIVNNCNFINNTAESYGGAIYWEGSNGTENNCNFTNNTAESNGGAIYWYAYNGTLNKSNFINNTAESYGGAIYWQGPNGSISDSVFKGNKTGDYRNIYGSEDLVLSNSTLETFVTISQIPDSYEGNDATVYFTFDDGTNLGGYNVTLYNNNQSIGIFRYEGSSEYNYTWDKLAVGNYSITVGEINTKANRYLASYEPMNFKVIDKYSTRVVINPIANVTYNSEVVVDFLVENRTNVNVMLTNVRTGETKTFYNISGCEFRIDNLVPGTYNVTIVNCENEMYASSNASALFSVAEIFIKDNKDMSVFYKEGAIFKVRIVDVNGKPLSGIRVTFEVGGKTCSVASNGDGYANLKLKLKPGNYKITVSANGKSVGNNIKVKSLIVAKKTTNVKKKAKKTIIKITVKGHKVKQTINVKFTYKGKSKVKVKFGKDMKKQTVSVKFKGKTYKVKVNRKGVGTIKLTKKVAKKLKKGKKYALKVTYNGPKLYKKAKLTIKFNGKKYNAKTNNVGLAKFKVTKKMVKKFKKGKKVKYTIAYKQDTIKRFVKVK